MKNRKTLCFLSLISMIFFFGNYQAVAQEKIYKEKVTDKIITSEDDENPNSNPRKGRNTLVQNRTKKNKEVQKAANSRKNISIEEAKKQRSKRIYAIIEKNNKENKSSKEKNNKKHRTSSRAVIKKNKSSKSVEKM